MIWDIRELSQVPLEPQIGLGNLEILPMGVMYKEQLFCCFVVTYIYPLSHQTFET